MPQGHYDMQKAYFWQGAFNRQKINERRNEFFHNILLQVLPGLSLIMFTIKTG